MTTVNSEPAPTPAPAPAPDPPPSPQQQPAQAQATSNDRQVVEVIDRADDDKFRHDWRVLGIFAVLVLLSFLSALDASIITTSLPTITREIGGGGQYVWVANAYLFASTVPQPFYGQLADVVGRRDPFFASLALFLLGSGLAGGARDAATLIGARVVQGLGSAGLYVLPEIIMCDLVPPRRRGPYLSALLSTAAVGTTVGPIVGGALAQAGWRWIFWINLPVVGVGAVAMVFLFRVRYRGRRTWRAVLARLDLVGNAIFVPSVLAIFFGLIMGGNRSAGFPWDSWRIILPLVLGILGWIGFHVYEASPFCREPSMPPRLFKHRTSSVGYLMIFLIATFSQAISFFLPVYFQAVKGATPLMSGIDYLPFTIALLILAGSAAGFLTKTGRYRPVHWVGWALSAVGAGLFSMLDEKSSTGAWIGFQIVAAGGVGFIFTVSLPSTLAALDESDVAVATGTYAFLRTFGFVWGVTMSSIAFNGQVNTHLNSITDPSVRELLADGAAYAYASGAGGDSGRIGDLPEPSKSQVIHVYVLAMRVVWLIFVGVSAIGFFSTFVERHIELRKEHATEFGLADRESPAGEAADAEKRSP
ncbi:putative major facilitator superfamily MFS-1 [Rosellinia necatrix]|uniref:Putative major facilitator superfamily MFS-1 n=1 Tax=Rosellinia necatrix TaxID=77044 RepID=A0A1W2TTV9_ROSNE|nr:putative major facilitator superfamily MFS-1 [Rosellinia necatrix]